MDLIKTIRCYLILNCWSAFFKTHHSFLSKIGLVSISVFPVAAGKLPFPFLNLDVLFEQWTRTFIPRFRASVTSLWERQTGDYKTVTLTCASVTSGIESSLLKANPSHDHELQEVPFKKKVMRWVYQNCELPSLLQATVKGKCLQKSILFIPFPSGFSLSLLQKIPSCFFPIW